MAFLFIANWIANLKFLSYSGWEIEFGNEWVHLRKSNTEPIIRIYSESGAMESADLLAQKIMKDIKEIAGIW